MRRCDLARALHVAVHLLDQLLGRGEAPLAAQASEKIKAQRLSVEVALEVEDVGLHQLATTVSNVGRTPTLTARGVMAEGIGEARVHPVAGAHERVIGNQVGGGETQLASALVSRTTSPRI